MNPALIGLAYHHGHGHGIGSDLFSTVAHAAVWSIVGRLIWHAPALAVIAAGLLAGGYLLFRGRARGRR